MSTGNPTSSWGARPALSEPASWPSSKSLLSAYYMPGPGGPRGMRQTSPTHKGLGREHTRGRAWCNASSREASTRLHTGQLRQTPECPEERKEKRRRI